MDRPLVELVEDQQTATREIGLGEESTGEDALGDDFDACGRRHSALPTDAVADETAHRLPTLRGHARGHGPRGQTSRLEHRDALPVEPPLVHQFEGNERALARSRRRGQDHYALAVQGLPQMGEGLGDRKGVAQAVNARRSSF
jgi:hypothetical protein